MAIKFNTQKTFYSCYGSDDKRTKTPDLFYTLNESKKLDEDLPKTSMRMVAEHAYYDSGRPYYLVYPCINELSGKIPLETTLDMVYLPDVPEQNHHTIPYLKAMHQAVNIGFREKNAKGEQKLQTISLRFPEGSEYMSILACFASVGAEQYVGLHCNLVPPPNSKSQFIMHDSCVKMTSTDAESDDLGYLLATALKYSDENDVGDKWEKELRLLACLGMIVTQGMGFLERDILGRDIGKPPSPEILDRATRNKGLGWTLGAALDATPHSRRPHWGIRHVGPGRKRKEYRPIKGCIVKGRSLVSVPTGMEGST